MKKTFALLCLVAVTSCGGFGGKTKYDGPTEATSEQFAKVLYSCAQENSNPVTVGGLSRTGVNYREESLPSCGMMKACLGSQGYFQDKEGRFDLKSFSIKCAE